MNNSNWIELHDDGKGIIVAVNSIAVIEEDDNQHSFIYLKFGQELEVDESYTSIISKLGINKEDD